MNALEQSGRAQAVTELEENRARLTFDRTLYPLDAVYGAAYVFIDRCYVFLDAPDPEHIEVTLQARENLEQVELEQLAGTFANELLSHAWRHEITEANRPILEAVTAQALSGALGPPGLEDDLDDLDDMDFSEETFEDPLGIAMSWEEKYGGQAQEGAAGSEAGSGEDGDGTKSEAGES